MYFEEFTIYSLVDPEDGTVRYVGRSKYIKERYYSHYTTLNDSPVSLWVQELRGKGLQPLLYVLEEEVIETIAGEREMYWMDFFLAEEEPLLNRKLPRKDKLVIRR